MLDKTFRVKLTPTKINRWSIFLITIIIASILTIVTRFLYNNFYQVITQAKDIILLRQKVVVETVNMEKFNQIMEMLNKKNDKAKPDNIKSPFD